MVRRVRRDVVYLSSQHSPSIFPPPSIHCLQQRRRDPEIGRPGR
jgi:hypothetical protein